MLLWSHRLTHDIGSAHDLGADDTEPLEVDAAEVERGRPRPHQFVTLHSPYVGISVPFFADALPRFFAAPAFRLRRACCRMRSVSSATVKAVTVDSPRSAISS